MTRDPGRIVRSSWYITQSRAPMPAASGLAGSSETRMSVPGALVWEPPSRAVEIPALTATWAPPCQATRRPPPLTQSRSARLPLAPSACMA